MIWLLDSVFRQIPSFFEAVLKSNVVLVTDDHKINIFKSILYHFTKNWYLTDFEFVRNFADNKTANTEQVRSCTYF